MGGLNRPTARDRVDQHLLADGGNQHPHREGFTDRKPGKIPGSAGIRAINGR